ncbi:hypothetical protein P3T76_001878 [Phytophthora citrophthora]|uniref:Uncharacterized protein n=1 Tax=Phytophthora citrophthora TaxID=4793 RepID=A0AAD9LQU5_9STRA|nr:hypothetical protein P3T76_001878 [Phytophthora citrophthora]
MTCRVDELLGRVVAHVLLGHVREVRPLFAKIPADRIDRLDAFFDSQRLNVLLPAEDILEPKPWFAFEEQRNTDQQTQSLLALEYFDNTARWPCDREKHESKRVAFESKPQRAAEVSGYTATINVLKCNATDHADDIEAASAIRG